MKTNGIIRKLDSLGRIVIPREYRKMHKIHVSDPLGIFALENGDIVIRKVDVSAELRSAGEPVASELARLSELAVILCDSEQFLTGTGALAKEILSLGDTLSERTKMLVEGRKCVSGEGAVCGMHNIPYAAICPVYRDNLFGALLLLSDTPVGVAEEKMLKLAANILGNMMQRF